MAKDSESRRAWVKNAAIIFLAILLLLTFFSNTILNYSLPEVSAQYAKYGTLTTAVKADGTIKANASYNVIYEAAQAEAEGGTVQSRKVISGSYCTTTKLPTRKHRQHHSHRKLQLFHDFQ